MSETGNPTLRLAARALVAMGDFRGKVRLARRLSQAMSSDDGRFIIEREGARFKVMGRDLLELELLFGLQSTRRVVRGLLGGARGKKVLWDVGANIGSVSLRVAAALPDLEIWAFEPSPLNTFKLATNVDLNPLVAKRIQCLSVALSDHDGLAAFFPSAEQANSGVGGLHPAGNRGARPFHVSSSRAESLILSGAAKRPDIVKIDVEGWELEVLRGFGKLLADSSAPDILVENEPYHLKERGIPLDAVPNYLTEQGYRLAFLGEDGALKPYDAALLDRSQDLWARKEN